MAPLPQHPTPTYPHGMSIFTKIASGEIAGHVVYEDEHTFAFLDINPRAEGHTLVVPRVEVDQLFELEPDDYTALWSAARTVAAALKEATKCERVYSVVIGDEVPHAHIHLIPSTGVDTLPFPPVNTRAATMLDVTADRIREALA